MSGSLLQLEFAAGELEMAGFGFMLHRADFQLQFCCMKSESRETQRLVSLLRNCRISEIPTTMRQAVGMFPRPAWPFSNTCRFFSSSFASVVHRGTNTHWKPIELVILCFCIHVLNRHPWRKLCIHVHNIFPHPYEENKLASTTKNHLIRTLSFKKFQSMGTGYCSLLEAVLRG